MSNGKPISKQQQILDTSARVETILIGVPGTAETGLVGDVKEMKKDQKHLAVTVGQHSEEIARLAALHESDDAGMSRKKKAGLWGGLGTVIASAIYGLFQLFKGGNTPP